jgi:uncharacterized damage-inducible protein DinB
MPTAVELADAYFAGVGQLRDAVQGMTPEQLAAKPIPGKMSTLEVVAHIADFEPILADRIQRLIALDNPTVMAADENEFLKHLFYDDRNADEELAVIEAIRRKTARLIRKLSPEQLKRTGTHSEKGPVTLERIIQMATNHIPHHLPFIAEKRTALGIA